MSATHRFNQLTFIIVLCVFTSSLTWALDKPTAHATDPKTGAKLMKATSFPVDGTHFYVNNNWLAIDPNQHKQAETRKPFPFASGTYDVVLFAVGENDGASEYRILKNDEEIGHFLCPLSTGTYAEGKAYNQVWPNIRIEQGDAIAVQSKVGSQNGQNHSRGRWAGLAFAPVGQGARVLAASSPFGTTEAAAQPPPRATRATPIDLKKFFSDPTIRQPNGNGDVAISGEQRLWHKVTLTMAGPFAHELDKAPNPFTDYRMTVVFEHESGELTRRVPGYFAVDGDAANTGADSGTRWRAHLAPDRTGEWTYEVLFVKGDGVATSGDAGQPMTPYHGRKGSFKVSRTNKKAPDMRARGRLDYVGEHYLKFAGTGEYFLKCGADAPENLLAYRDFDGPFKTDGQKDNFIKSWEPHVRDWQSGDPTWQDGKGKGLIGAINYLASEGMNAFSFLPMNIEGDDRNVFPYTHYDERLAMDVSRLAQWEIIFAHGTKMGMFLHFKTMETENEMLLDNGDLGPERKLYYRELVARFAHHPALNWNLGEEINEASTEQKKAWAQYFWDNDPYQHSIVIHNMGYPHYDLLGPDSALTGFSLQTSQADFSHVHKRTLDYVTRSAAAGKPWAVACDEPGDASHALLPDKDNPEHRNARVNALWGHFTAGGWGLEWYFGYKHDHSDLTCEDWRSRDLWWDQCRHALNFFSSTKLPVWEMSNADTLVEGDAFCLAKEGGPYLVVLKTGGTATLDLTQAKGTLKLRWFNPRTGEFAKGGKVTAGDKVELGPAPDEPDQDWVVLVD